MVLAAVNQNRKALIHTLNKITSNRDVALAIVKQSSLILKIISGSFRRDVTVVVVVFPQNKN